MRDPRERAQASHRAGRLDEALAAYREALALQPEAPDLLHGLALVQLQLGRDAEALPLLRGLVERNAPDAPQLLAMACRRLGLVGEGIEAAQRAVRVAPDVAVAWMLLGSLQVMAGAYAAGEAALRRAVALEDGLAEAWHFLGVALQRQRRWRLALQAYRRAAERAPGNWTVEFNAALCLESLGEWQEAAAGFERAHRLAPHRVDVLGRLANVQALLCDFDGEARSVALLEQRLVAGAALDGDDKVEPFVLAFLPFSDHARARILRRYAATVRGEAARLGPPEAAPARRHDGPLRLGYLSPDLGNHAVGSLLQDLFAAHDRERVTVHAYALQRFADDDPVAARIRAGCDVFRDVGALSTREIARTIAGDGIDVLVDLGGYTSGARPAVLALRPAPVQMGYLGFIHSAGAEWIDYQVLDAHVAPPGIAGFNEAIVRLPGTMLPAPRVEAHAIVADRAAFGLPEGVPLLASFNNSYKLDRPLVEAWLAIARRVPHARFVVYLPAQARPRFAETWAALGGDPAALLLVDKLAPERHAVRAASCDLFLDAFRYQAGATAIAALEAGLPVLSRRGDSPLARLGVSLNLALGLDALVADDADDYVARAVALVLDPERLAILRGRLASAVVGSGLFDPGRVALGLEQAAGMAFERALLDLPAADLNPF